MTKKNTAVKSSSPEEFLSVRDRLLACETVKWAEGFSFVAGVDEAGRGCMAGPVVAAAVVFTDRTRIPAGVFDSKQLSHAERMRMRERILAEPSILYAVGEVSPEEIDRINILRATWKAMGMALEQLKSKKEDAYYIGDSEVDVETAHNAGLCCVGVTWGFRDRAVLEEKGAEIIIDRPEEILALL